MPGELPLVLLSLIADRPQGGYELLGELERRFGPSYRPSPGSVYPALSALRTEELIQQVAGQGKASYLVTSRGRRMLAEQGDLLANIETRTSVALLNHSSLQPALARFSTRISKHSGRVDRIAVEGILDAAAKAIADLEVSNEQ